MISGLVASLEMKLALALMLWLFFLVVRAHPGGSPDDVDMKCTDEQCRRPSTATPHSPKSPTRPPNIQEQLSEYLRHGQLDKAKAVLKDFPYLLDMTTLSPDSKPGFGLIHWAAYYHDVTLIQFVIEKKPDALKSKDRLLRTPLLVAIEKRAPLNVIQMLIDPAVLDVPTRTQIYPLRSALYHEDERVFFLLLKAGARPEQVRNVVTQSTILHYAAHAKRPDALQVLIHQPLLQRLLEQPERPDDKTALFVSCEKGDFESANMLLEAGANPNARDELNATPLEYAIEPQMVNDIEMKNYERIVELLVLKYDVDVSYKIHLEDNDVTLLQKAAEVGTPRMLAILLQTGQIDLNYRDARARDALMLAMAHSNQACVDFLLALPEQKVDASTLHFALKRQFRPMSEVVSSVYSILDRAMQSGHDDHVLTDENLARIQGRFQDEEDADIESDTDDEQASGNDHAMESESDTESVMMEPDAEERPLVFEPGIANLVHKILTSSYIRNRHGITEGFLLDRFNSFVKKRGALKEMIKNRPISDMNHLLEIHFKQFKKKAHRAQWMVDTWWLHPDNEWAHKKAKTWSDHPKSLPNPLIL